MNNSNQQILKQTLFFVICAILSVVGRVIPHPPNVSPFLAVTLLAGTKLSKVQAVIGVLVCYFISNFILSVVYGLPLWGNWVIFSSLAYAAVVFLAARLKRSRSYRALILKIGSASLLYWVVTNAGVWIYSGMYSHNVGGFIQCYTMALPFLSYALVGDLFWGLIIFGLASKFLIVDLDGVKAKLHLHKLFSNWKVNVDNDMSR